MNAPAGPPNSQAELVLAQLRLIFEAELTHIVTRPGPQPPEIEPLRGHEAAAPEEQSRWQGHDPADPALQPYPSGMEPYRDPEYSPQPVREQERDIAPYESVTVEPDRTVFSPRGEKYLAELAAKAEHIHDTESGPRLRTELNTLFDRNEAYLREAYDKALPADQPLDPERHARFAEFAESTVDAILRPENYRAQEQERAPEAIAHEPDAHAGREQTDTEQAREGQAASREMTDAAQQRFSDLGEAMRHEAEQNLQRPQRGMSLDM